MKELKRLTLDELAKVMPVIDEEEQKQYFGGNAYNVGGSGTQEDPIILQATFNIAVGGFGKYENDIINGINAGIAAYEEYGTQVYEGKYYKFEMVVNTVDPYSGENPVRPKETTIAGSGRPEVSHNDKESPVLGNADGNLLGGSGINLFYNNMIDIYGSGNLSAIVEDTVRHEVAHTLGLEDTHSFPVMSQFNPKMGTGPGALESGTMIRIIEKHVKDDL